MTEYRVYRTVHYAVTVEAQSEADALAQAADMSEEEFEAIDEDAQHAELAEE